MRPTSKFFNRKFRNCQHYPLILYPVNEIRILKSLREWNQSLVSIPVRFPMSVMIIEYQSVIISLKTRKESHLLTC